jgi:Ca2+-transporting ATPase
MDGSDTIISSDMIVNKLGGIDTILKKLGTKPKTGISPDDVERRKKAFGANFFPPPHIKSLCELIMENFEDKINLMLLAACIVSLIIGYINEGFPEGMIEGTSIAFALIIIVSVNSGNNYISERRLANLVKISNQQKVDVYRNSEKLVNIDGEDLVVGDLFYFHEGMKIPCDGIMIAGEYVTCVEGELTGEPDAFEKVVVTEKNYKDGVTGTLLAKSTVASGSGTGLVLAVGTKTVAGVITAKTQGAGKYNPETKEIE